MRIEKSISENRWGRGALQPLPSVLYVYAQCTEPDPDPTVKNRIRIRDSEPEIRNQWGSGPK